MRAILIGLISFLLLSCSSPKSDETHIYLTRHFEKEASVQGASKDPNLTSIGQKNAERLAAHLEKQNIGKVFSTDYQRTIQTAIPTSEQFKLDINIYDPRDLSTLVNMLKFDGVNKLIVGHSNTTPALFGLLGCGQVSLNESDYGDVFLVRFNNESPEKPLECTQYKLKTKA